VRLLFASTHGYLDPSSGAALATREILALLAARGADCRVLSTGVLDYEQGTSLDEVMTILALPTQRRHVVLGHPVVARSPDPVVARSLDLATFVEVIDMTVGGVGVALMPTASSRAERSPDMRDSACFLDLADQVLERFRPHVLLTYGGHPACLELMRRAPVPDCPSRKGPM
jgi:hypothetical protein